MRRTTSLAAAVAVALCSLTFAACGGDDTSSDSSSGKIEGEISLLAPEYSDNTERLVARRHQQVREGQSGRQGQAPDGQLDRHQPEDHDAGLDQPGAGRPQPRRLRQLRRRRPAAAGRRRALVGYQERLHRQVRRERQVRRHAVRDPVRRLGARALLQQGHVQAGGHPEPADDVGSAPRGRQEDHPTRAGPVTGCRSGPRRRRPSSRCTCGATAATGSTATRGRSPSRRTSRRCSS